MVETGFTRLVPAFCLSPSGQRDQNDVFAPWLPPNPACDLVAGKVGQTDIHHNHVRTERFSYLECFEPVMRGSNLEALGSKQRGEAVGCVTIVIDDQKATDHGGRSDLADPMAFSEQRRVADRRQAYDELTAAANAFAVRFHSASMELHELLDQAQADTQSRRRTRRRHIALHEKVEHPGELPWIDADAVIAHSDHDVAAVELHE